MSGAEVVLVRSLRPSASTRVLVAAWFSGERARQSSTIKGSAQSLTRAVCGSGNSIRSASSRLKTQAHDFANRAVSKHRMCHRRPEVGTLSASLRDNPRSASGSGSVCWQRLRFASQSREQRLRARDE